MTVGDDLRAKVQDVLDRYGHLPEFRLLLELLVEVYEELEKCQK